LRELLEINLVKILE
jgi:hypothetical protein